jgi:hypothetical protein
MPIVAMVAIDLLDVAVLRFPEVIAEGMPERFAKILCRLDEPSNEGSKGQPTSPYQSNSNSM